MRKLLIANRGEIAVRIARTARSMGIATVAVFSDADARAPHVRACDEAVRIGPPPSVESYLRADRLLEAALRTGADALHPGYGFLSERAELADACAEARVTFVGPPAAAIRAMGSKIEAKRIAAAADVPVIPGYSGDEQDTAALAGHAQRLGFPVLIKASAGGGGKGMRVVRDAAALEGAIDGARREATSSFGDGTLLIEKYLERPRHIEIQILGDAHGTLVHLGERECSIQRRHQKIVEESPSPAVSAALRAKMGEAALRVARAIGYQNAGTVEMVLDESASGGPAFYFLEVNTRLQVEHPVTEAVTGLDLVREQLRVARGEPLGWDQDAVRWTGHAIECRLYAEDPAQGFLPMSGRIVDWHVPDVPGLRVDTGVEAGSEVSIHYDPMLAKVITHAPTRAEATAKMAYVLERLVVQGIPTNAAFMVDVLRHPEFAAGRLHTHFIDDHLRQRLGAPAGAGTEIADAAVAATLASALRSRAARALLPALRSDWRNNAWRDPTWSWEHGDQTLTVSCAHLGGDRWRVRAPGATDAHAVRVHAVSDDGRELAIESGGVVRRARVVGEAERTFVHTAQHGRSIVLVEAPRFPERTGDEVAGGCTAPMPGKVVRVAVETGQSVESGAVLVILEAMKMEHTVSAPYAGVVERVLVAPGDQVAADALLVTVAAPTS